MTIHCDTSRMMDCDGRLKSNGSSDASTWSKERDHAHRQVHSIRMINDQPGETTVGCHKRSTTDWLRTPQTLLADASRRLVLHTGHVPPYLVNAVTATRDLGSRFALPTAIATNFHGQCERQASLKLNTMPTSLLEQSITSFLNVVLKPLCLCFLIFFYLEAAGNIM